MTCSVAMYLACMETNKNLTSEEVEAAGRTFFYREKK